MSRSSLKKADLVSLASELGIDTEGLRKQDIDEKIASRISASPDQFESDPRFQGFLSPTKKRRSPRKPTPDAVESKANDDEDDDEEEVEDEVEAEDAAVQEGAERIKETLDAWREQVEDQFWALVDYISDLSATARSSLSTVQTVALLAVLAEYGFVVKELTPFDQTYEVPGLGRLHNGPDLNIVWSHNHFWFPLAIWVTVTVALPLVTAYFFNFKSAHTHNRRQTRSSTRRAQESPLIDPLVFAVSKVLYTHGLFNAHLIADVSKIAPTLKAAVGDLPYFSGVIIVLLALYTQ